MDARGTKPTSIARSDRGSLRWLALLPALVLVAHALAFGGWLVDDAYISFGYARNLALGHGPVLCAGGEPVEGFSNPLWVALLTASAALGAPPPAVAKPLGVGAAALALILLALLPSRRAGRPMELLDLTAPLALAGTTGYAMWASSGLENGLTALLATLLVAALAAADRASDPRGPLACALGLTLVRPEGVLFLVVTLLILAAVGDRRRLAGAAAGALVVCAALLLLRRLVFGFWLPNTFAAKLSGVPASFLALRGADYLLTSALRAGWFVAAPLAALGALSAPRPLRRAAAPVAATALLFPVLSGGDWMPAGRFLTPLAPAVALLAQEACRSAGRPAPLLACSLLAPVAWCSLAETRRLAAAPCVDARVRLAWGRQFEAVARDLGLDEASVLEADVGGVAWSTSLDVVDLAGLCDLAVARSRGNPAALAEYVFEERRPALVHLHGAWPRATGLGDHPRLRQDYLPWVDVPPDGRLYVRRDLRPAPAPEGAALAPGQPLGGATGDVALRLVRLHRTGAEDELQRRLLELAAFADAAPPPGDDWWAALLPALPRTLRERPALAPIVKGLAQRRLAAARDALERGSRDDVRRALLLARTATTLDPRLAPALRLREEARARLASEP